MVKSQMNADSDLWLEGFTKLFHRTEISPRSAVKLITTAVKTYRFIQKGNSLAAPSKAAVFDHLRKTAVDFNIDISQASRPTIRKSGTKRGKVLGNVYHSLFKNRGGTLH
jgi:hypothetical protein